MTKVDLVYRINKVFADILMLLSCADEAVGVYELNRGIAEELKDSKLKCDSYKSLGQAY